MAPFRTLLVKVPVTAADPQYAGHYVLILQNTDAQEAAIRSFRQVLILTIILFWALALGLSYWLSTRSMRRLFGHGSGSKILWQTQRMNYEHHWL